ncbi:hypothetical protein NADFUDRAFT_40677 [Nadsonia fulvescens var. elongata DSM 6958]|uniref:Uncharacterized protein n=1 Tax=Nadsonia fulvescens var. elongata DSM 6958 TaxID=857566 RepID=A0A1E3PQK7_9ASCO|nr:hypothetical protein NADFUDRAFT_40677 [Nadsonia fulvescens var. elongata DSM 6958]
MYNQGWNGTSSQNSNFDTRKPLGNYQADSLSLSSMPTSQSQTASFTPNFSYTGNNPSITNISPSLPSVINQSMNSHSRVSCIPPMHSMDSLHNMHLSPVNHLPNSNLINTSKGFTNFQNTTANQNNHAMTDQLLNSDIIGGRFNEETETEFQKIVKLRDEIITRTEDSDLVNTDDSILSEELKGFKNKYIRFKLEKKVRGDKESKKLALIHKHEGRLDLLPGEELVMTKEYEDQLRMAMDIDEQQTSLQVSSTPNAVPASEIITNSAKGASEMKAKFDFTKSSVEHEILDYGSDEVQVSARKLNTPGDRNYSPTPVDMIGQIRHPVMTDTHTNTSKIWQIPQTQEARSSYANVKNGYSGSTSLPHDPRASMFSRRQRRYEDVIPEKKTGNSSKVSNNFMLNDTRNNSENVIDYKASTSLIQVSGGISRKATEKEITERKEVSEADTKPQLSSKDISLMTATDTEDQNYHPYEAISPARPSGDLLYYNDHTEKSHLNPVYPKNFSDQYIPGYPQREINGYNRLNHNGSDSSSAVSANINMNNMKNSANSKPVRYKWNYDNGDMTGSRNLNERSKDPIEVFGKPQYGDLDEEN